VILGGVLRNVQARFILAEKMAGNGDSRFKEYQRKGAKNAELLQRKN
jgi:hypothetical protein